MGFSPLPPHWIPPCAPFPPPHGCRRLYRSCSGIVPAAAVRATLNCCATSAVAASSWSASPSPFGPAHDSRRHKSMLGHRSHPPYITFYPVPHLSPTSTFAQYFPSVADLAFPRSHVPGRSRPPRSPLHGRSRPGRLPGPWPALPPRAPRSLADSASARLRRRSSAVLAPRSSRSSAVLAPQPTGREEVKVNRRP